MSVSKRQIHSLITSALKEDHVNRDVTTHALFPEPMPAKATIVAKESLVIAGLDVARQVFLQVDGSLKCVRLVKNGDFIEAGTACCTISGDARSLLKAERVALNFLQHLSGVASLARQFCQETKGTKTKILDTRKTIPGLRALQKQAVSLGGGTNHRQSLRDGILIKDNHLALLRSQGISLRQACQLARKSRKSQAKVCVEAETLDQVKEALEGEADIILLDNMSPQMLRRAILIINERALTEISGGVTLRNIQSIAKIGADRISIGALTHSARAMDLSLSIVPISKHRNHSPRKTS